MIQLKYWVYKRYYFYKQFLPNIFFNFFKNKIISLYFKISNFFSNWVLSTNHRRIAVMYFIFTLISGFTGLILATIIRIELAYPGQSILVNNAEKYLTIISLHGIVMVFFMIIPIIFGAFGNFLLPTQLGIRDVAFPRLNSFMFWVTPSGFVMLLHIILFDKSYNLTYWLNYSELRFQLRRRFFLTKEEFNKNYRNFADNTILSERFKSFDRDFFNTKNKILSDINYNNENIFDYSSYFNIFNFFINIRDFFIKICVFFFFNFNVILLDFSFLKLYYYISDFIITLTYILFLDFYFFKYVVYNINFFFNLVQDFNYILYILNSFTLVIFFGDDLDLFIFYIFYLNFIDYLHSLFYLNFIFNKFLFFIFFLDMNLNLLLIELYFINLINNHFFSIEYFIINIILSLFEDDSVDFADLFSYLYCIYSNLYICIYSNFIVLNYYIINFFINFDNDLTLLTLNYLNFFIYIYNKFFRYSIIDEVYPLYFNYYSLLNDIFILFSNFIILDVLIDEILGIFISNLDFFINYISLSFEYILDTIILDIIYKLLFSCFDLLIITTNNFNSLVYFNYINFFYILNSLPSKIHNLFIYTLDLNSFGSTIFFEIFLDINLNLDNNYNSGSVIISNFIFFFNNFNNYILYTILNTGGDTFFLFKLVEYRLIVAFFNINNRLWVFDDLLLEFENLINYVGFTFITNDLYFLIKEFIDFFINYIFNLLYDLFIFFNLFFFCNLDYTWNSGIFINNYDYAYLLQFNFNNLFFDFNDNNFLFLFLNNDIVYSLNSSSYLYSNILKDFQFYFYENNVVYSYTNIYSTEGSLFNSFIYLINSINTILYSYIGLLYFYFFKINIYFIELSFYFMNTELFLFNINFLYFIKSYFLKSFDLFIFFNFHIYSYLTWLYLADFINIYYFIFLYHYANFIWDFVYIDIMFDTKKIEELVTMLVIGLIDGYFITCEVLYIAFDLFFIVTIIRKIFDLYLLYVYVFNYLDNLFFSEFLKLFILNFLNYNYSISILFLRILLYFDFLLLDLNNNIDFIFVKIFNFLFFYVLDVFYLIFLFISDMFSDMIIVNEFIYSILFIDILYIFNISYNFFYKILTYFLFNIDYKLLDWFSNINIYNNFFFYEDFNLYVNKFNSVSSNDIFYKLSNNVVYYNDNFKIRFNLNINYEFINFLNIMLGNNSSNLNFSLINSNYISSKNIRLLTNSYMKSILNIDFFLDWRELRLERDIWRSAMDLSIAKRHWLLRKRYFANFYEPETLISKVSIWMPNHLIPGWAFITPYSSRLRYTALGKVDIALVVVLMASVGSVFSSINYVATYRYIGSPIFKKRRELRSFFIDALLVASRMMILANPALIIGIILLLSDRHFGTSVFDFSGGGDAILFQHLFWFFGHPEVYIIIIPCFGFMNSLLPYYLKKRLSGRLSLQFSMYTIAFMGFAVWGHHMYMVGLANSVRTLYSTMTVMISVPASTKVLHWCVTIINSTITSDVGFLFLLSFMYFFVLGGLSGMFLAHIGFDVIFHDTFYVIGHFHVMLAGAAMSCIFAAFYFYFPAIFGVKYNRLFAYLHFTFYVSGQLLTLIPMFWLGYAGMPRRIMDYPSVFSGWHSIISSGHILTFIGFIFFFLMIFDSIYENRAPVSKTRGVSRLNTRFGLYIYETRKLQYNKNKALILQNAYLFNNKLNHKNLARLELENFEYVFIKK